MFDRLYDAIPGPGGFIEKGPSPLILLRSSGLPLRIFNWLRLPRLYRQSLNDSELFGDSLIWGRDSDVCENEKEKGIQLYHVTSVKEAVKKEVVLR